MTEEARSAATTDGWTGTLYPSLRCDYCGDEVVGSDASSLDAAKEAHRENCPWKLACEHVDLQDPLIAGPRWREALNTIIGFAEANEQHHTGFRHIRRIAQAALGKDVT